MASSKVLAPVGMKRTRSESFLSCMEPHQIKFMKKKEDDNCSDIQVIATSTSTEPPITHKTTPIKVKEATLCNEEHERKRMKEEMSAKKIECLECEIAILNEMIEKKISHPVKETPVERNPRLQAILSSIIELNQNLLLQLKDSRFRRAKHEAIMKRK